MLYSYNYYLTEQLNSNERWVVLGDSLIHSLYGKWLAAGENTNAKKGQRLFAR